MASGDKIIDVLFQLRRLHFITDLTRVKHYVVFPGRKLASLEVTDTLGDVGLGDLSVLHVRTAVRGGAYGFRTDTTTIASTSSMQSSFSTNTSDHPPPLVIQRVTNSPLVLHLPWSIHGISDEGWRNWPEYPPVTLKVPPHVQFNAKISQQSPMVNCPVMEPHRSSTHVSSLVLTPLIVQNRTRTRSFHRETPYLVLQAIQLLAEKLGIPRNLEIRRRTCNPRLIIKGKSKIVMDKLHNWRSVVVAAGEIIGPMSRLTMTSETHNETLGPADLQRKALYDNLTSTFCAESILCNMTPTSTSQAASILSNLTSTAFLMGCYCEGKFDVPKSMDKVLDYLSGRGFEIMDRDRKSIQAASKNVTAISIPLRVALSISFLALLLPIPLITWAFSDVQLVEIFRSLGTKPTTLVMYEKALTDELWEVAQGLKSVEMALRSFLDKSTTLPNTHGIEDFFGRGEPGEEPVAAGHDYEPGMLINSLICVAEPTGAARSHGGFGITSGLSTTSSTLEAVHGYEALRNLEGMSSTHEWRHRARVVFLPRDMYMGPATVNPVMLDLKRHPNLMMDVVPNLCHHRLDPQTVLSQSAPGLSKSVVLGKRSRDYDVRNGDSDARNGDSDGPPPLPFKKPKSKPGEESFDKFWEKLARDIFDDPETSLDLIVR
ncbi:hypothetical protein B0H11DRAFT_1939209 [Mycena galericulata]|nr:hypothetical protein B0H11DRAFT_1939209 [Mycena galericulata]